MEYRRTLNAAEQGILRDAYRTLERFAAPPPAKGEPARAYWQRVARDTDALVHRWHDHPLALELALALTQYLICLWKNGSDPDVSSSGASRPEEETPEGVKRSSPTPPKKRKRQAGAG